MTMKLKKMAYREAVTQLRLHAPMIWQRNNFFLLTQSGLLAFYIKSDVQMPFFQSLVICSLGALVSIIWLLVVIQGRVIQRQWRDVVRNVEKEVFLDEDGPFARANKILGEGKRSSISITLCLIVLSTLFIVSWLLLLGNVLIQHF